MEHDNVNPMLVFRNAVCNQRWDETWKASMLQRQHTRKLQRGNRTQVRCDQALARFLKLLLVPAVHPTPSAWTCAFSHKPADFGSIGSHSRSSSSRCQSSMAAAYCCPTQKRERLRGFYMARVQHATQLALDERFRYTAHL